MSTDDEYEFTVEWPSTLAKSVIVTGDFDQWSRSLSLSRTSAGVLSATIKVPYGCPTRYKFIVDGEWKILENEPTELTSEGYLNNVHYVPLEKPASDSVGAPPNGNGTAALPEVKVDKTQAALNGKPREQDGRSTLTPVVPQFISDLASTIAARDGTSSALGYVASGIGATIRGVVGVDPINSNQIPIPTPTSPEPSSGLPSATNTQTIPDLGTPQPLFAPIVPITIVPVYAKENCTINPNRVTRENEGSGFVGVGSPHAIEDAEGQGAEAAKEAEPALGEMGVSTHAPIVLPVPAIVTSSPSPTSPVAPPVKESVSANDNPVIKSQEELVVVALDATPVAIIEKYEVQGEEGVVMVDTTEQHGVAADPAVPTPPGINEAKPEEKAPVSEEKEKLHEPTPAPEPAQIPLPPTPAKSATNGSNGTANGHHKSLSTATNTTTNTSKTHATSTSTSTSRPTTPTPAADAASSVTSTPNSKTKKKKIFPQLGNGSPSKNKEDGKGTTTSKHKKRTSSIFGKLNLKNLFHHHDKKDEEKVRT